MRRLLTVVCSLVWILSYGQETRFDKARILDINYLYEYPDFRLPCDFTQKSTCNPTPLHLEFVSDNRLNLSFVYADCYTSNDFEISLDSSLNILHVRHASFSDNLTDQEETTTTIEQFHLYFNKNPFRDTVHLIGRFSAIVRNTEPEHAYAYPFDGKFKFYSQEERSLTPEELRYKMELKKGFMDKNGIYGQPEVDPEYCQGKDSLDNYLKSVIQKYLPQKNRLHTFYFTFVINKAGRVETIEVEAKGNLVESLKGKIENELLESCWIPALNYGETVKSTIHPWVKLE